MRLRTQISLMCILALGITAGINLSIAIKDIRAKNRQDIDLASQESMLQIKNKLKDIVGIAYELVNAHYQSTVTPANLERMYGAELNSATITAEAFIKNRSTGVIPQILDFNQMQLHSSSNNENKYSEKVTIFTLLPSDLKSTDQLITNLKVAVLKNTSGFIYSELSNIARIAYFKTVEPDGMIIVSGIKADYLIKTAMDESKHDLRKFLYDRNYGYIFINNMDAFNVMHPFIPEIEGTDYSNVADMSGKKYVPEMVDICKLSGEGFLYYYWPKYNKANSEYPIIKKLSFVKLFKPWNWIIGTGDYIDHIELVTLQKEVAINEQVNVLILKITAVSLLITAAMILLSVFLANSISQPIVNMIKNMKTIKLHEPSSASVSLKGCSEIRELGNIFNQMLSKVNDDIKTIRTTSSEKERLESELKIAEDIQRSILPQLEPFLPQAKEFDIYAEIQTGKPVGGDLYDFFFIDDEHLCLAVGDVSDRGIPATLFMTITRTILRTKAAKGLNAGEIITEMNRSLCANNEMSMYVRFFLAIINLKTGKMCYSNAGNTPAYIVRNGTQAESLPVIHGIPLGITEEKTYSEEHITLKTGDKLIFYTDGLVNAVNYIGHQFGDKRLLNMIEKNKNKNAQDTVKIFYEKINEFTGNTPLHDDILVMCLCYSGKK